MDKVQAAERVDIFHHLNFRWSLCYNFSPRRVVTWRPDLHKLAENSVRGPFRRNSRLGLPKCLTLHNKTFTL